MHSIIDATIQYFYYVVECSLSRGSDKVDIVICKLASNSIRKRTALIQLIKSATSNSLTTVSHQNPTKAKITAAYQASITNNFMLKSSQESEFVGCGQKCACVMTLIMFLHMGRRSQYIGTCFESGRNKVATGQG